ncbi:hypothetical protein LOD99_10274 [Oopsacas minuta]|uniref:Reverse transcriptase domain-containing protein n=1 Tax=Oopsacas minuta TaxID=111878 RepID=A0AAV7KHK4_9METZ|nr:hypothetical protein LOD99_10274 [Oopsacas minuta]
MLPTRSKLMPPSLTVGLTLLFYYARRRRRPHIRKIDKGMGLYIHSKRWLQQQRALARSLYLLNHTYIQVDGIVYQQVSGLSQGSVAAPFLADFTLFMLDLKFRELNPDVWHGRYLDDIILVIPSTLDPDTILHSIQSLYQKEKQLLSVQHAGTEGYSAWLGFEIKPTGEFRVHIKPTWVNLFSPLYDAISPRLHFGYLITKLRLLTLITRLRSHWLFHRV